jgi:DNA-binding NarL/FixJ family response regulator
MLDRAKIILMSSNTSEETIKEGRKLNLEKLLIKPFPPETLMEAVEKVFQLKKDAA